MFIAHEAFLPFVFDCSLFPFCPNATKPEEKRPNGHLISWSKNTAKAAEFQMKGSQSVEHRVRFCLVAGSYPLSLDYHHSILLASSAVTRHLLHGHHPLLVVELALVESELLTLEDVSVAAAGLAGPAGNDGVQATSLELLLESGIDLAVGGKAGGLLLLDGLALLDDLFLLAGLLLASTADGLAVVGLVPLTEGGGVDLDDGGLGQGVGADQLVVGGVVGDDDDTGLAGAALGGPGEVTRVETQGTVLVVAAAGADGVDALGADTGLGRLATKLESALLPVEGTLGTGGGALVARVS